MQILKPAPVPTATEIAIKNASAARVRPETKSPAIVSLMALVMARPGTRSIIEPMIV